MGTLDSVTCTSAIFAWWKVRGSKFAQPPDGGVFGSGVLRRVWYVTRAACLTRILTRTAQAVSERARQSTSQRRRRRASRAPVTVEDAVGGAGSHRSAFARSGRDGRRWTLVMYNTANRTPGHGAAKNSLCPALCAKLMIARLRPNQSQQCAVIATSTGQEQRDGREQFHMGLFCTLPFYAPRSRNPKHSS